MKIVIDATLLKDGHITGVERYIIELLNCLSKMNNQNEVIVLLNKHYTLFDKQVGYGKALYTPTSFRIYNDQIWIPYILSKIKPDITHFPVFGAPLLYRGKFVMTIHDATLWKYADTISIGARYYYKPLFNQAVKRAQHIITDSKSSENDLKKIFKLNDAQISVIYLALSTNFSKIANQNQPEYHDVVKPYILSVGTIEPRKNLNTLIKAFNILKNKYQIPHDLILTGRKGWLKEIQNNKAIETQIRFTGFVDDNELYNLYKYAAVYVFPSIYEGFGLPLLEAFACGTPVVASNRSSLPEIGANACIYVDPESAEDFAECIYEIIINKEKGNKLINDGYIRLHDFDWDKCGKETLAIYTNAII